MHTPRIHRSDEVADALAEGRPVVALESTLVAHGLPRPDNLRVARELEDDVRAGGAVPATVAVLDGDAWIGLAPEDLDRVATGSGVRKLSVRDLAPAAASRADGATTVASTAVLAAAAGVHVFATGGLGGVHREARETWDESADLVALARTDILVVCAGVKSILDVQATLERLETLGVTVAGYRTDRFPGFYLADSGHPAPWRVESPAEAAAILRARRALGLPAHAVVLANPIPPDEQLDADVHEQVLADALRDVAAGRVTGSAVTPFLLERFHTQTSGESLRVNIAVVRRNARLAAAVATALADDADEG